MSEWLKEAVLKTVVPQGTVGSNPTPSAKPFAIVHQFWQIDTQTPAGDADFLKALSNHAGVGGQIVAVL